MGYADDETRGIPRAMHANGFSRPTRRDATRGEATRGERRALLVRLEYVDGDGRTNRRSNSANTRWREKPCKRSRKGVEIVAV